jgi:hypothetical protein
MKSVMQHSFSQVPRANIQRSVFNRDHGVKTTYDADFLIPVLVDDIVPGDSFSVDMTFLARLTSPTVLPLMDNLYISSFFFFIPYRLVWDNWEKFCGAQDNPGDSISYTIPVVTGANTETGEGTLWDYFGLPLDNKAGAHLDPDDVTVSCLPWRAYALCYNEWFRDQNLQNEWLVTTDNGPDDLTSGSSSASANDIPQWPLKRGKRHDYFTSCLPWPQRGTAATLDLGTYNVSFDGADSTAIGVYHTTHTQGETLHAPSASSDRVLLEGTAETDMLYVDLSTSSVTVNDLRTAFQTQRLLERDARSGTRYNETILAHFGVTVPDFRVQRPEFLGGGTTPVNISPVAQTTYQGTQTVEDAKGALAGIGTASGTHGFTKSFTEHGILLGLVCATSDITYSQGIERYWSKSTRYDFYYPVLAHLGEQTVYMREIWTQGDGATTDDTAWGYQERYAEMRYKPSRLTGLMSVEAASNLDEFHLSEDFTSEPSLDAHPRRS